MGTLAMLAGVEGVLALSVVSPGPNFAVVSGAAMSVSRRVGIATALGVALGSLIWVALAVAGLGVVLGRIGWLSAAIGIAGAVYLVWLGARMVLAAGRPSPAPGAAAPVPDGRRGMVRAAGRGLAANMANPKAIAFYASIFAATVPAAAPPWAKGVILLLAAVTSASWYCAVALLFSRAAWRGTLMRARPAIDAAKGSVLVVLGVRLLARSA